MLRLFPDGHPSFPIVNVGRTNISPQQMAHRIDDQNPLATFDEFATIKANLVSRRRTILHTLQVNNGHSRQGLFVAFGPMKYSHRAGGPARWQSGALCHPGLIF